MQENFTAVLLRRKPMCNHYGGSRTYVKYLIAIE